jgi:phage shock protein A
MVDLGFMLDQATTDIDRLDEEAVKAKAAHRVAYARAFIEAQGPVDVRKNLATVKCETLAFEWDIAEQKVRACKQRLRTLESQIDIARSLGATIRSEWAASGMGLP